MKALLIYVLGSCLIVTVFGGIEPVPPVTEPPPPIKCGCNMIPTRCNPCNQICNQPPRQCALFCTQEFIGCVCKDGFSLPEANSKFCIPTKRCPKPNKPCNSKK